MREFTLRAVVAGAILGLIFGASSLHLVLKVGLTMSASIPVAVISITLFRLMSRFGVKDATILEHNIVQTGGSAGESIAFGIGVTMPAIMILGFDLEIARVALVAVLGTLLGTLLGILMMIPLRRAAAPDPRDGAGVTGGAPLPECGLVRMVSAQLLFEERDGVTDRQHLIAAFARAVSLVAKQYQPAGDAAIGESLVYQQGLSNRYAWIIHALHHE